MTIPDCSYLKGVRVSILCLALFVAAFALCLPVGCGYADTVQDEVGDENRLHTIDAVISAYETDTARAMAMVDSAEAEGLFSRYEADMMRARLLLIEQSTLLRGRALLERMLRQEGLTDRQRLEVLDRLVYVARIRADDGDVLRYGADFVELAARMGDEVHLLAVQALMGESMAHLGREDEGFTKMDDAIAQLDRMGSVNELDACIKAMKGKIRVLLDRKRYDEVPPLARRIVQKMDYFEQHSDAFPDRDEQFASEQRWRGYADFYRGQAYAYQAHAFANLSALDSTRRYLSLFERTGYSRSLDGQMLVSYVWCVLGYYDRMNAIYDTMAVRWGDDTLKRDYAVMLENRSLAARQQGKMNEAYSYLLRYSNLVDQLSSTERVSQAQDYAAHYHEQEQRQALALMTERARRGRVMAILWCIVAVLALGVILTLVLVQRSVKRKNRLMAAQASSSVEKAVAAKPDRVPEGGGDLSDEQLFRYLAEAIRRERLYTDRNFGRQTLVDRFHISERRIGAAFSFGGSLPDFIRELRLEHARSLLVESPDMPISQAASNSGFHDPTVFGREFKRKYGLTPSAYRQQQ